VRAKELLKASFKLDHFFHFKVDHFFPLLEKPADFRYWSGGREKSEKTERLSRRDREQRSLVG
jgi:hypothetical protein